MVLRKSTSMKTLTELLNEVIEHPMSFKDVHLEYLYGHWSATTCHEEKGSDKHVNCRWHGSDWFEGRTPEAAVRKLLKHLKKK